MDNLKAKPLPTDLSFDGLFAANSTYRYFKDAGDQPFLFEAHEYQSVNAWWLAECSMLVYVRDQAFVSQTLAAAGLPHTHFFENEATQSFVCHNENFAIVCFRGTEVGEIQDLVTDIDLPLTDNQGRGKVHQGFKKSLDLVWDCDEETGHQLLKHLHKLTADKPQLKVWFTGHSLGAALATLAADRYPHPQGLYTYGSPRVGDKAFARLFDTRCYRFVNNNDVVTMVPPEIGYQHVGLFKYIDDAGEIHDNPDYRTRLKSRVSGHIGHIGDVLHHWGKGELNVIPSDNLNDHAPIYYVVRIWNNHIGKP